MPPKKAAGAGGGESKKAVQKKKAQLIEDKTFGLKNKNKSKKVQQQVKSIEKNVLNSGDPKLRKLEEERKAQRALAKAQRKAMEDERNALFGEALLAVQKKNKNTNMQEGKLEAKGRDGNDEADKKGTSRAMKMMYQMDAQEMAEKLREDVSLYVVMTITTMSENEICCSCSCFAQFVLNESQMPLLLVHHYIAIARYHFLSSSSSNHYYHHCHHHHHLYHLYYHS